MCLNDDPQHGVAKNPVQWAHLCPLIFQELESRSCRGHKVMISATALTVNLPVFAAGGPITSTRWRPPSRAGRAERCGSALSTSVQPLFEPGGALGALHPGEPGRLKHKAMMLAEVFQRSSSNVEGRHGSLSSRNHELRGLDHPRKRACLTAVHNFLRMRPDGTTAAERFFGQKLRSMFAMILEAVEIPPLRPSVRRDEPEGRLQGGRVAAVMIEALKVSSDRANSMDTLHGLLGMPALLLWCCVVFTALSSVLLALEVLLRGVRAALQRRRLQRRTQARTVAFSDAYDDPEEGRRMPPLQPPAMEYHTYLGFIPKASVTTEGYCTNRYHFRYAEDFPVHKAPHELRIFITGGSKAWGAGVTQGTLYTQEMEASFQRAYPTVCTRVICAAGTAYCSVQERIMVENHIAPLAPDYIVMFSGRNDCFFGYVGRDIRQEQDYFGYRRRIHPDEHASDPSYDEYGLKLHYLVAVLRSRWQRAGQAPPGARASVPPARVVDILRDNIHSVSDLAKRQQCTVLFYLGASIFCTAKRLSPWEQSIVARGAKHIPGFPAYNRQVYSMLRTVLPRDAQENGYLFVDGDEAIQAEERSVFVDNTHISDRGYRLVAQHLFQALDPYVRQQTTSRYSGSSAHR